MSVDALTRAAKALHEGEHDPLDAAMPSTHLALVREAVARLGWGTMGYACEKCGFQVKVWMALGVEGPHDLRAAGLYLASPFTTRCFACPDGTLAHSKRHGLDAEFAPRLIPDDAPRFVLPESVWRGDHGASLDIPEPALVAARRWFHEDRPDTPPDAESNFA